MASPKGDDPFEGCDPHHIQPTSSTLTPEAYAACDRARAWADRRKIKNINRQVENGKLDNWLKSLRPRRKPKEGMMTGDLVW